MRRAATWLVLALFAAAPAARAQYAYLPDAAGSACLDRIPAARLVRVPVVGVPFVVDSAERPLAAAVALALQSAVELSRTRAGLPADSLPPGEPDLTWRQLDHDVLLVVHRDGRLDWRTVDGSLGLLRGDAAARWFVQVIRTARAAGEMLIAWPDGLASDSAFVRIGFQRPSIDERGVTRPVRAEVPVPLFSVGVPPERLVAVTRAPRPRFPTDAQARGFEADLVMQFVVDTAGRADPATARPWWPEGARRPGPQQEVVLAEFVRTVQVALDDARYEPARLGGCVVPALVQQSYFFRRRR
ncbi:MAG: hypothetical protein HY275_07755 [Gemmatimonadetes bacterium]|nr:hypothetical protein [Gemmatimonadota bacterium]